jgi:DNA (cytosine-5)-methyltransferase 1
LISESNPIAIDLFAGAGGLSSGLQQASFDIVLANEISPVYSETLKSNHIDTEIITDDIRSLKPIKIRKSLGIGKGELDLLAGGPPCQGFSINAPIRSDDDHRNHLFNNFLLFVKEFEPKVVLIENVPGIVSYSSGDTVASIVRCLQKLGYKTEFKILYAAHFGVPQMRWRTIFLATKGNIPPKALFPVPTHKAKGRPNFTTVYENSRIIYDDEYVDANAKVTFTDIDSAIGDLPELTNGGGSFEMTYSKRATKSYQKTLRGKQKQLYNHKCARLGAVNLERIPHIPQGGSWRDIPYELLPEGMKRARRSDHTKRYGRLHPERLGSTILTKCDPHWGAYIHPSQDRVLSVREAARIQSFRDGFIFYGSVTDQYEQVGNAVPPLFAKSIGRQICSYLEKLSKGEEIVNAIPGSSSQVEISWAT